VDRRHARTTFFAYADNYLIDLKSGIIMDVQASRASRQGEIGAFVKKVETDNDRWFKWNNGEAKFCCFEFESLTTSNTKFSKHYHQVPGGLPRLGASTQRANDRSAPGSRHRRLGSLRTSM
jgi:hypothetical protein